jgi:hypothetical protein
METTSQPHPQENFLVLLGCFSEYLLFLCLFQLYKTR